MEFKELRLDLEATVSEALFGHGYAHYGYWPHAPTNDLTAEALGKAQQAYVDVLAARIPKGTRTILDVGSGTGANARELCRLGYEMECLSPSAHMNALARAKLSQGVKVHTTTFETFECDRTFDLCLFAESFHYIDLDAALRQLARYAASSVLIFDYFRKTRAKAGGTRTTHDAFLQALSAQGDFEIVSDEDLTQQILPTFQVLDRIKNAYVGPFVSRTRRALESSYPLRMKLAQLFIGKALDKIEKPSRRAATFPQNFEYRLILLRRR
ncbi:MAG: class I SAM-dependent methyltransferase [Rhodobacter sp.]|nr:class I SAM-dependent methyltransferase [Rhodobacter sp.]